MSKSQPVTVHVLDKEYTISCKPDEHAGLLESAQYLDGKMREIRDNGRVLGADKITLMAALNITHELIQLKNSKNDSSESVSRRIRSLQDKIERALNSNNPLEL
ncbi:MAG: cell division protein ZapA [Candidatus Polarisedimenticolaceae bacterium]|nr:cell division protein ZapA [Candidatus Polarisedimenticolaceae bacterium]